MAILINLLPEVRQNKIKAKRQRQLAITSAVAVCAVSLGVVAVLALITGGQALLIGQLQRDIDTTTAEIKKDQELPRILTVQSHLASLNKLYDSRVYMTSLFKLLPSVTPGEFALSSFSLDANGLISVTGTARSNAVVDKFVKALEAGRDDKSPNQPHFSNAVITSITKDDSGKASFSMTLQLNSGVTNAKR